jgi:hypothetical protein
MTGFDSKKMQHWADSLREYHGRRLAKGCAVVSPDTTLPIKLDTRTP